MCHNNRIPKLYSLESFHDKFNKFSWYLIFQRTCYSFSGLHNYIVCQKTKPKKIYFQALQLRKLIMIYQNMQDLSMFFPNISVHKIYQN